MDVGYLAQQEEPTNPKLNVLEYFRLEAGVEEGEARGILARYLFYGADVFRSVGQLSGGEWTRLRLALLVQRKPNVLLLDEPTNHLDIASREALEESLVDFEGTVLAISHDRYFVNRLASRVWELEDGQMTAYLGDYEAYREKKLDMQARAAATTQATAGVGVSSRGNIKSEMKSGLTSAPGGTARSGKKPGATSTMNGSTVVATGGSHDHKASTESGKALVPSATTASNHRSNNGNILSAEKLEKTLARLEAQIQVLDQQLETVQNNPLELEQIWNDREQLSAEYNDVLAQWAEL